MKKVTLTKKDEKVLNEIWLNNIAIANNHNFTRFIFLYKSKYYFSEFRDGKKWSDPVEFAIIKTNNL